MSFVKGQQCFVTINPWSKQGSECRQYFKTRSEVVIDEFDIDISKLYIRKAIVAKVNPKYYMIRYEYTPEGGYWIQNVKILKDEPYYEKDTQFCCLSSTYEEAYNKLRESFKQEKI